MPVYIATVTSSPALKGGASPFYVARLRRILGLGPRIRPAAFHSGGVTSGRSSPRALAAGQAIVRVLRAALRSRSIRKPQASQVKTRRPRGTLGFRWPQLEQVRVVGAFRSVATRVGSLVLSASSSSPKAAP